MSNKATLVRAMAAAAQITGRQAAAAYDELVAVVHKSLTETGEARLSGLGRLFVSTIKARKGFNIKTREPMDLPESKVVRFRAHSGLKDAL